MMKKYIKLLLIFLVMCAAGMAITVHATLIAPQSISVRHEEIISDKIPTQMNGIKILFFSDVHYNQFVDQERFLTVVEAINNQRPDIVLFGGDLFDHPANNIPSSEIQEQLIALLKEIEAPLGKFAVLGNHDLESESVKEMVTSVLVESDFEIIINTALRLRNKGGGSIVLAGLDSELLGNPDIDHTFSTIQSTDFTLVLCHTPDTILDCPTSLIDLYLAGHGHGGQVYIPFLGAYYKAEHAEEYYRGRHQIDNAILDVSNGTGTTKMDIRFLADAEIVLYTLKTKTN